MSAVLDVRGLTVAIGGTAIVHGVDLRVDAGECVALVGASGSGKTVTARAVLGLSAPGAAVHADAFEVDGVDVRGYPDRRWRRLRGSRIGYVGQEALGALDPLRPVGREVADTLRLHTGMGAAERVDAVRDVLAAVGLDPDIATDGRLAGTLSGGMRQRALIAAATVGSPALLVADEPTTALDAGVAVTVMEQLRAAQTRGAGLLVITHDLGLVAGWADRVAVVHEGRIVEQGAVAEVFAAPQHPATQALVRAAGAAAAAPEPPHGADLADRCEVDGSVQSSDDAPSGQPRTDRETAHRAPISDRGTERATSHGARGDVLAAHGLSRGYDGVLAVDDVSFGLERGRVLGVIGASGSGKTTLARMLLGLETPDAGTVTLDGEPWVPLPERDRRPRRHRVSAVVQDSGATFDERWNVERVLADAFSRGDERRARGALGGRVDAALRQVDLDPALRSRSPRTLSGGQRQRLAIARALATDPEVIVLDEPVTALDATVQDAVLRLLERLRDETGVAMVFVSHDLRAVRRMADEVLVVHRGAVVEHGPAAEVFARPAHPVTARLLHAAERLAAGPAVDAAADLTG
ncbi:ATP-binding cassette domain-containing protein [Curtobacterium aurantiacum]|uniref:ABC transporter ATP-binding protein n=1 Tax=Curtobacterium aurantiacum TaxID=3236919 RepID=A0ABS5VBE3_9MICO|nr:ABC transporter ATP-binding protein [Curtobacterium flaccumfaciens]MBT1544171.1 ABC transporter ATP-binding protein [Curtobacterium flaccumfaciens pv. flaccumfaciens]MBT1586804.1 ABC transporter ATP-binding protein [Curtobacterium flaccumfaciens pv. flaccumfaciens]